jgi:hypothetical protein
VEYISYILIILVLVLSCFLIVRVPAQPRKRKFAKIQARSVRPNLKSTNLSAAKAQPESVSPKAQLRPTNVPTPWGWPGHNGSIPARRMASPGAQEVQGVSESLYQFVDHLFKEKHTVEDREYLLRKSASLRALVEDRYGRAGPLHDGPGTGTGVPNPADSIKSQGQPGGLYGERRVGEQHSNAGAGSPRPTGLRISSELKDIRRPWGW